MGFLEFFKPKENKDIYQTLVIQQMLKDIQELKQNIKTITLNLDELQGLRNNKALTKLENKIYMTCSNNRNLNIKEIASLLNLKESSLKVYVSKIRKKNYKIDI